MKCLSWLIATLFLSQFVFASPAESAEAPPVSFDKVDKIYRLVQKAVFDIDVILKDIGINVYACRLDNGPTQSFKGVGACIYESVQYTFKKNQSSSVWIWVLNSEGKYLPPLKLEWKNSHSSWSKLGGEFLFLTFENFFGRLTKKADRVVSQEGSSTCTVDSPTDRDLGNFIGDLSIAVPKGRKLSEYFVVKNLDGLNIETLSIHATSPFYLNKKRAYKVNATIKTDQSNNEESEFIQISMLTNYNLVARRDSCFKGSIERPDEPPTRVTTP